MNDIVYHPLVSIIVPTYNEEEDIADTLEALVCLAYDDKEIIVVDDSQDSTPSIVERYSQVGVKLLKQGEVKGRSAARNQGILSAQGEIVIILNADVSLPADFIERILPHYERGADYVLVGSEISNAEHLFPRYTSARGHHRFDNQDWINWTEGFSCRRQAAIDVGLFPADTPIPICAGEDGVFGGRLEARYQKVIDRSIVVTHVVPHTLKGFWRQRKGRGRGTPQIRYFVHGLSLGNLRKSLILHTISAIAKIASLWPLFVAARLVAFSPRGLRDLVPFAYANLLEEIAILAGHHRGYREIGELGEHTRSVE
jgi:glycosyltransferase involved in cell wall biosynthesis